MQAIFPAQAILEFLWNLFVLFVWAAPWKGETGMTFVISSAWREASMEGVQ